MADTLTYKPLTVPSATKPDVVLYIPPEVEKFRAISTLFITDMPFSAAKAINGSNKLPIIGYKGINDKFSETIRTFEPELVSFIQRKKVSTIVLMYNADVVDPHFKPGEDRDLATPLYNTYFAVKQFKDSLLDIDNSIVLWFAHPKHHNYVTNNVRTLDDFTETNKDCIAALSKFNKSKEDSFFEKINLTDYSMNHLNNHLNLKSALAFYNYHKNVLAYSEFTFKHVRYSFDGDKLEKIQHTDSKLYLRVSSDYYKRVMNLNSHDEYEEILMNWKVGEIGRDYGVDFIRQIPRYDSFVNKPNNSGEYQRTYTIVHNNVESNLYNIYHPIDHEPIAGEWPTIEKFLTHIFSACNLDGETLYQFGLDYLQLSYLNPRQRLPILALVSSDRNTGKSTFLDFLKLIFGANMSILDNQRFSPKFTSHFAGKLFVAIDEGHIPINDKMTKEMIKNMATGKVMWLEAKGSNAKGVENFTHLIFCSNDEKNFMQIDPGENRFAVLKVPSFRKAGQPDDPDILDKMRAEIPHFLNFLENRKLHYFIKTSRFWFPDHVYVTEALRVVMNRTKNTLEKEVEIFMADAFISYKQLELHYTLSEITEELNRESDFSFTKTQIRDFLLDVYNIAPGPSLRYTFYSSDSTGEQVALQKKGRYCTFQAGDFLSEQEFNEVFNNSENCVPKVPKVPPLSN